MQVLPSSSQKPSGGYLQVTDDKGCSEVSQVRENEEKKGVHLGRGSTAIMEVPLTEETN